VILESESVFQPLFAPGHVEAGCAVFATFLTDPEIMSSGGSEVAQSTQQFNEIVAIVGLPRSGTTLATSVFDAHPFSVACYEPWNRASEEQLSPEQTPRELVTKLALKAEPNATIFVVKETTVDYRAIQWLTKFLQYNARTHRIQIVWSLRNYRHNYLSFVEAAREWWGHTDMKAGSEGYSQWVERARRATVTLLTLYQKFPGAIYAYESLAEDAPATLPRLMDALDLKFSPQQLDYLQHYSPKQVHGDVSMSSNPRPISNESIKKREAEWDQQQQKLSGSDADALRQQLDQFWQNVLDRVVFVGQVPATLIPERLKGLIFRPGHEYREAFSNKEEWEEFARANSVVVDKGIIETFAASISRIGFTFAGEPVKATEVSMVDKDYRDSFVNEGLASRNRAAMIQLHRDILGRKTGAKNIRVYTHGTSGGFAAFLTKLSPQIQSSEYFPDPEQRKEFSAIEHKNLTALPYADASFDYVFVDDIFQHVPNLDKALGEALRVLAPGGILLSTFPFAIDSEKHLTEATLNTDGSINYQVVPEDPQNHIDEQRDVVFQIPGWNILEDCRSVGFKHAEFVFLSSPSRGVLASNISGVIILRAVKFA
jgi:SAM-dependent methyltransferase